MRRPIPYPVVPPAEYRRALERGTRSGTGEPGARYWQQWTEYRLSARILPATKRLEGSAEIRYHNRSPDALRTLHLDLTQNFHAPGGIRLEPAEVTGGVELRRVTVAGQQARANAAEGARYEIIGSRLVITPANPLPSGGTVTIAIDYAFTIPKVGASGRMGWNDDNFLYLAYWYPQMAVYDDVFGWHPDPFAGNAEFYAGFGRYDVTIDAPEGWLVMSTGWLENAEQVLPPAVLERLRRAERSDSIVRVIGRDDFGKATRAGQNGRVRWHFLADSVRDVAFSVTRESNWDATRTSVGDRNGDGQVDYSRVDAIWRESAPRWANAARYAQHSIRELSRITGIPYPWPHMSAVEGGGIIGGGMEFPMMTLIGDYNQRGDSALYYVVAHELAHMWVPMIVSNDERRFGWMDEGTTTFNENEARKDFFPGDRGHLDEQQSYIGVALANQEGEMIERTWLHDPGPAAGTASYAKPSTVLVALRGLIGEEMFTRALRTFYQRWKYKHPYPWDMWNTFESVSGRDLDWFWRTWYYETWTLDHSIASVESSADSTTITIEDRGWAPMPARLTITLENGQTLTREVPVETWLAGNTLATVTVPGTSVTRVEIDPERHFPDVNRSNNVWTRTTSTR